jgi:hypothetical protein
MTLAAKALFFLTVCNASFAQASSSLVGTGKMTWFGFHLYDISLYTATGKYIADEPLSLSIQYKKPVASEKLIEISQQEVERLGLDWNEKWSIKLAEIWPSIEAGDELNLNVTENGVSEFYFNDQFVGQLDDSVFSENFTAIWLSPKSRESKLRKSLIGASK